MFEIEEIYMNYKDDIFYYLMSLTHDYALSEDLLSETFTSAIKGITNFKGNSSIRTWLFAMARNLWLLHLRNTKKNIEYNDMIGIYVTETLEDNFFTKEAAERIQELINLKDKRTQDVVRMRIDGIPYIDIAFKLGISESSARVIDFRCKKWLKNLLEKEGLYEPR